MERSLDSGQGPKRVVMPLVVVVVVVVVVEVEVEVEVVFHQMTQNKSEDTLNKVIKTLYVAHNFNSFPLFL